MYHAKSLILLGCPTAAKPHSPGLGVNDGILAERCSPVLGNASIGPFHHGPLTQSLAYRLPRLGLQLPDEHRLGRSQPLFL